MVKKKKFRSLGEKQQVVNEVLAGRSASEVGMEYRIHPSMISKWVKWHHSGELAARCKGTAGYGYGTAGASSGTVTEQDREVQKLQAELRNYKEKVGEQALAIDLLKKALEDSERAKRLSGSVVTGKNWDPLKGGAK
jgi:transposase-like protein